MCRNDSWSIENPGYLRRLAGVWVHLDLGTGEDAANQEQAWTPKLNSENRGETRLARKADGRKLIH